MSTLAKGNQIVTTGETVERFSAVLRQQARFREHRTLRCKRQLQDIYELPWDDPLRTTEDGEQPEPNRSGPDATLDSSWMTLATQAALSMTRFCPLSLTPLSFSLLRGVCAASRSPAALFVLSC